MTAAVAPERQRIETRFGVFSIDEPQVISFPSGIPGFESCRRFVLIASPDLAPLSCLQALDSPQPSFLALDPLRIDRDYQAQLTAAERALLKATEQDTLLWLAIVGEAAGRATANLRAPIVINPRAMMGCQLVRNESPYGVQLAIGEKRKV